MVKKTREYRMINKDRQTYTVEEAALMLGCSRNLAYNLARQGKFPGVIHLGEKRLVVSKIALDNYLQCGDQGSRVSQ
jgi:excisionase family DNA binding protein